MKKVLFLLGGFILFTTAYSQSYKKVVPQHLQTLSVPAPFQFANDYAPVQNASIVSAPKSVASGAWVIGNTRYDLQTNSSCQNRIYIDPGDGTIGAAWTRGTAETTFPERGTGYNYNGAGTWGPAPTSRIETVRTGWPSYQPWNGGGEIIVSHEAAGGLVMSTRPVKGTGAWTQTILPCPSGVTAMTWPRMITNGTDHNTIHIFAITLPTGNSGTVYNGLDGALLYFRSTDGGATWDKNGIQIDPLTSSNYTGFGADTYAWATPHEDTLCFLVGGSWTDTFILKSDDNGETWNKIDILSNAHKMDALTDFSYPFYENDGANAIEMDHEGVMHCVFGRMCVYCDGTGRYYRPYTDGLIYWNSTMPPLQDSLYLDTLYVHGQLLGYVFENAQGDPLVRIPYYGVGMTSFPQITIDPYDRIYVIWSGVTVGNPYVGNDSLNYRHLWTRNSYDHGVTWHGPDYGDTVLDLNHGLAYIYKEFVFPSMDKNKEDEFIHFIYQSADVPGNAFKDPTNVAYHDNTIEYRQEIDPYYEGINEETGILSDIVSQNSPNPFHGNTSVTVTLQKSGAVSLLVCNLMGQQVLSSSMGILSKGEHSIHIDGSSLSQGVYFYTVRVDNKAYTRKMVVE